MTYEIEVIREEEKNNAVFYDFDLKSEDGEVIHEERSHHMTKNQARKRDKRLVSIAMTRLVQEGLETYTREDSSRKELEKGNFKVTENT